MDSINKVLLPVLGTQATDAILLVMQAIGLIYIASFALQFIHGIYARLIRPGKNLKKAGKWAIVTGATDGIGLAMAEEFMKKGLCTLLISRSQQKLDDCAQTLRGKYASLEVQTLAVDYSAFGEPQRVQVKEALQRLNADGGISVLVNNVGISYPFTKYFHELTDDDVAKLMSMNVDSTTWMTRLVLPFMKDRKAGYIVNIGSAAGVSTSPLLAQYGAAKSYIAMFSRALNYELRSFGVHVQCQVPMFVVSKLAKIKAASLSTPLPKDYAKPAVRAIGYETVVSPYWSHAMQIWALTTFPESISAPLVQMSHMGIRQRGLKKEAGQSGKDAKKD